MWHPNIFGYLFGTYGGIRMYLDICLCPFYDIHSSLFSAWVWNFFREGGKGGWPNSKHFEELFFPLAWTFSKKNVWGWPKFKIFENFSLSKIWFLKSSSKDSKKRGGESRPFELFPTRRRFSYVMASLTLSWLCTKSWDFDFSEFWPLLPFFFFFMFHTCYLIFCVIFALES